MDLDTAEHAVLTTPLQLSSEVGAMFLAGIAVSGAGVALFDQEDRYVFGSPAFVEFLDVQPGPQTYSSLMRHCHTSGNGIAIPDYDIEAWLRRACLKRRSAPIRHYEKDLSDGRWLRISETTFDKGWVLNILCDITDLKSHEAKLRQARDAAITAADTDSLTGLRSRAFIEAQFSASFALACDADQPLTIALIDLDHFKTVNDRYGHLAGDKVLMNFAGIGRAMLRGSDFLGRIGGEEFLVIMPGTRETEAVEFLQGLRQAVENAAPLPIPAFRYTMSAGVATMAKGETAEDLYRRADAFLYSAKAQGRNCVLCAPAEIHGERRLKHRRAV